MPIYATVGSNCSFGIPQRVIFTVYSAPVFSKIHPLRVRPMFFHAPAEPSFSFASRNVHRLASQQLLAHLFIASLLNNYRFANQAPSNAPQYHAQEPQSRTKQNQRSSHSETAAPVRPANAEEDLNAAVKARAFKLLNIQSNNPSDYAILGLPESASKAQIKKAYFTLSRAYHPDKYQGDDKPAATEAFRLASEAYEHLVKQPK